MQELLACFALIEKMGRGPVYYGSARLKQDSPHWEQAVQLGRDVANLLGSTTWSGGCSQVCVGSGCGAGWGVRSGARALWRLLLASLPLSELIVKAPADLAAAAASGSAGGGPGMMEVRGGTADLVQAHTNFGNASLEVLCDQSQDPGWHPLPLVPALLVLHRRPHRALCWRASEWLAFASSARRAPRC